MTDEYPKFLYKYRTIDDLKNIVGNPSLKALLKNEIAFSNKDNFNDLFDSKIKLIKPTPKQFRDLKKHLNKQDSQQIASCINKEEFTLEGYDLIERLIELFNRQVSTYYYFLCLSKNNNSNLMWSHYASSHTGFCIEFKTEYIKANKVTYKSNIPTINIIDLVKLKFKLGDDEKLGYKIWDSLRTKLIEWEYEEEYRFQASNSMLHGKVKKDHSYCMMDYKSEFIESIIFGCRMPSKIKTYIVENMHENIKYKEVKECDSSLEVVAYEP
ncbi:DUF2971 domain-containing protein [Colwellia demingiae]|uniref:DUF2971 domain-containing protein n=1 Tax=Colwellia demingiae TaxID=89401 RepID=A0A5C6QCY2_9GAMM|nr:DUF2971 domain-containing protein [Colwellia demingiae]TWX66876.1 DUF2971 domain-containing protein [Colwellia demingiae]